MSLYRQLGYTRRSDAHQETFTYLYHVQRIRQGLTLALFVAGFAALLYALVRSVTP